MKHGTHLFHLFVSESHQCKGIARKLWSHAIQSGGASEITVRSSLFAVPVYKAFGFKETGDVGVIDGLKYQPMSWRVCA